jgi:hypothetical protein
MFRWREGDYEKFDERVRRTEDHWLWTGHVNKVDGYGRFKPHHDINSQLAHVLAYERWVGPVPEDYVVDHIGHPFRLRRCVKPDHLEAITKPENTRRGVSPAGENSRKTHCSTCGLPLDGDNLHVTKEGWRVCLNCRRRRHREKRARERAAQDAARSAAGASPARSGSDVPPQTLLPPT